MRVAASLRTGMLWGLVVLGCSDDRAQPLPAVVDVPAAAAPRTDDAGSRASSQPPAMPARGAPAPASAAGAAAPGGAATVLDAGAPTPARTDAGGPQVDRSVTLHNGGFWTDTRGERIEAHGGGFIFMEGVWYWIGEDKSHNSAGFRAVNCYASRDLSQWEFQNAIITRQTAPELDAMDRIIERPKLIYNDSTRKYVMWLHWEGQNYAEAAAGVFTSDSVCGDYAYEASFRPNDNMSRDDNLFKDDDGTAYFVSAARENADLIIYRLSDDYLSIDRQLVTLWRDAYREAPALFKHDGVYYLITSGATGWDPNQAKYSSARSLEGPWAELQNLGNATTYDTQPTYVIPVVGSLASTYVLASDRWQDPDLASSKYIWLPLKMSGTSLALDYYDAWQLDVASGEWSVRDDYLPQSGWTVLDVSSEEVEAEDGAATRAFDDSPSTFWHSRYTGGEVPYPHELSIDLGQTYLLDGLRYLPRQDGSDHGMIADYAFYASLDATNWGAPLSTGRFETGSGAGTRSFPATRARYVRLVAESEIQSRVWASVAELDLSGSAAP